MAENERDIITGRYEAHATPSNFLGEAGVYFDCIPTIGAVPDCEHDDPADVKEAFSVVKATYGKYNGRDGLSNIERLVSEEFESIQDRLRADYNNLLTRGYSPEEAREITLSGKY